MFWLENTSTHSSSAKISIVELLYVPCTGCIILQDGENGPARLISVEVQARAGNLSDSVWLGWRQPALGAPACVVLGSCHFSAWLTEAPLLRVGCLRTIRGEMGVSV